MIAESVGHPVVFQSKDRPAAEGPVSAVPCPLSLVGYSDAGCRSVGFAARLRRNNFFGDTVFCRLGQTRRRSGCLCRDALNCDWSGRPMAARVRSQCLRGLDCQRQYPRLAIVTLGLAGDRDPSAGFRCVAMLVIKSPRGLPTKLSKGVMRGCRLASGGANRCAL
jgi:hypothetical protein